MFKGYDGKNNPDFTSANFAAAMDEHMGDTCTNAKADSITIYTIAFAIREGSPMETAMRDCASFSNGAGSSKLFYDAKNNQALKDAFKQITESIQALRISQ